MPNQTFTVPYPFQPSTGSIELPPADELRLRALASQGYKLAALRQVVDLTGAPITTAREYLETLLSTNYPAPQTDHSPHTHLQSES